MPAQLNASHEEMIRAAQTTLISTHRLVGLDMVDEILVVQSGKVRERSKQLESLQAEDMYWKLFQAQQAVVHVSSYQEVEQEKKDATERAISNLSTGSG